MSEFGITVPNNVVILKLGGSSITEKGRLETLNDQALKWVAEILAAVMAPEYMYHPGQEFSAPSSTSNQLQRFSFIVVHGAGSFGHLFAKQYGLQGKIEPPKVVVGEMMTQEQRQRTFHGLAKTRAR